MLVKKLGGRVGNGMRGGGRGVRTDDEDDFRGVGGGGGGG